MDIRFSQLKGLLYALLFFSALCQAVVPADESNSTRQTTAPPPTLTIVGSRNIPPFSMLNQQGEPAGIGIDMWRLWSQKSGIPVRFRLTDISRSLDEMKEGRADLHAGLLYSAERSEWLEFTKPFLQTPAFLYYQLEEKELSLKDFSDSRIGTQGPIPKQLFDKLFPNSTQVVYENIPQMIRAVDNQELDGYIADRTSSDFSLLRLGMRGDFIALGKPLFQITLHAAVAKDNPELLSAINDGLSAITRDEMDAILTRWIDNTSRLQIELPLQSKLKLTQAEQAWLKTHKTIRIAIDPDFAPYEFIDERGNYQGVSADTIQLIARKLGINFKLVATESWEQTLALAANREIDLLPLANRTREREGFLNFTEPYLLSQRHIITRRQQDEIETLDDLAQHRLALPSGYSIISIVRESSPEIKITEAPDIPTALQQVSFGAADATILSSGVAGYWLDRKEITNLRIAGTLGEPSRLTIASRNDWPELGSIMQKALQSISDEERDAIRRRWIFLDDTSIDHTQLSLTQAEKRWIQQHPSIKVGVNTDARPISFIGADGEFRGLAADYLKLLEKRLGLRFQMETNSQWFTLLDQLQSQQLDIIGTVSPTDERKQYMRFSLPYYIAGTKLYLRNDDLRISTLNDLKGKRVAVEKDYWLHERLSTDYPSIDLLIVENTRQALDAVTQNRADAYIGIQSIADQLIKEHKLEQLKTLPLRESVNKTELRLGIRKDWTTLSGLIDKALASITPAEHRSIKQRWFSDESESATESLVLNQQEREWLAQHQQIEIGVMQAWPPMDFIDAEGNSAGIGKDIIDALNRRLGGVLKPQPGTWVEHYASVRKRELPALMGITPTTDRSQEFNFTEPYLTIPHVIVTQKDHPTTDEIADLVGQKVAIEKDFMLAQVLKKSHPGITLTEYRDTSDALDAVSRGEADAYIGNRAVALYLIEHELISNLKIQRKITQTSSINAIGVRKDWPILRDILQKTLSTLSREEIRQILKKWVPDSEVDEPLSQAIPQLQLTPEEQAWIAEGKQIRIGVDPAWEPIEFVNKAGTYRGISADFLARIEEITGLSFSLVPSLSWSQVIDGAKTGDIDILPALTPSAARSNYLNFTETYLHFPFMIFTRSDAPLITGIEDLYGLDVAVESEYITIEFLQRDHPNLNLVQFQTTADALRAVASGSVNAYVGNLTQGSYQIDKLGLGNIKVAAPTPYANDLAIGVRKDWPQLQSILDKALAAIDENERRMIRQESLAIRYDVEVDYTLLWQVLAGAAVLLLLSLLWINQIRRQKAALAAAKAEADRANRFKSTFLANMSHEIRTPMNAIMGFSHLALQTELTERQFHYIDKIKTSSHALLGVINDILDFSKIEAGKLDIEETPFSLDETLENLASLTTLRAEEKGLEIIFNRDLKIPDTLIGDPLRIGQVLINLTGNAIKFTQQGEVIVSCLLEKTTGQSLWLRFIVEDSGLGIDPEALPRLFEPFTQLDDSTTRRFGGSGLGLSISTHLIELMQGELEVDSTPGKGSRFSFVLPLKTSDHVITKDWLPEPSLRGLRVLVVDDNPTALELISERLTSFTFDVTSSQSATEALNLLKQAEQNGDTAFELVLMDWRMPGLDGLEASRRIKRNSINLKQIPAIILITAYGREEVMQQAEKVGMDAVLIKPISPSLLFDTVVRVLSDERLTDHAAGSSGKVSQRLSGLVLLVEDNVINQQVAQELLEGMGVMVHTVNNGRQAIEALNQNSYDLVLMDLQMPEMDGYEATRRIRADDKYKALPLIAMTAHAMADEREACLAAGMDEHIPKPIDPANLYNVISQWLKPDINNTNDKRPLRPGQEDVELPEQLPGIDLDWGLERVGGNRQLYSNLLVEFATNHGGDMQRLDSDLQRGEIDDARRTLHTLEGISGNIGAHNLQEASKHLQMSLADGDMESDLPDNFRLAFTELLDGLQGYVEESGPPVYNLHSDPAPSDRKNIEQLTRALDDALAAGNADAKNLFQRLNNSIKQEDSADLMNQLSEHIQNYDFDLARECLNTLSQHLRK
jgi:polar amino acid transport system substrate-binding protein